MKHILDPLLESLRTARHVYIIGNGGSLANASHIANDLLSRRIRAHTIDHAFLTATGNDMGYAHVFARWLSICGEEGDVLIALSGSGTSPNILEAIKVADEIGMKHFLITDYLSNRDMQESEEDQIAIGHELYRRLKT